MGDHPRSDGCIPCPNQYVTAPVASQGGQHGPAVCLSERRDGDIIVETHARLSQQERANERTYCCTCADNERRKFMKPRRNDCATRDVKMAVYVTSHYTGVI